MKGIVPRNIRPKATTLLGAPFDLKFSIKPSSSKQTLMSLQSLNIGFFNHIAPLDDVRCNHFFHLFR